MSIPDDLSIVEYYSENQGYRCGYCKSPDTNYSHGMWAHSLSVQDYQDLIDRGWRRSGCYCYKPTLHLTCCPMYTIKCSILDFKISKSQKKKLKRFNKFLAHGRTNSLTGDEETNESMSESGDDFANNCGINEAFALKEKAEKALANVDSAIVNSVEESLKERFTASSGEEKPAVTIPSASVVCDVPHVGLAEVTARGTSSTSPVRKTTRPGDGRDLSRPQCKKAKLLRQERKEKKLAQLGSSTAILQKTKTANTVKSLEDFIDEPLPESPAHRLEIKLVRSCPASKEFESTFKAAFEVYQRYQMIIHNDRPEKLTENQFARFLVNSPLKPWKPQDGPSQGYGSFHQQYWLDGRLIAVGVIDILPHCVSSVYFFYDPEFQYLVLGTYGSLREIAFCRSLHHSVPGLRHYYMGFYIHSCPKMRYKGAYAPSFLLCPEVYSWHPIESCLPLLERNKYSRFNEDTQAKDPHQVVNIRNVLVLFHNEAMTYQKFLSFNLPVKHLHEVAEYASLVGDKLSKRMLLLLML